MDYHRSMSSVHFLQRRAIHLSNSFGRDSDYLPRDFLLNNVSSNTVAWDNCSMESAIDEAEVFPFALQFTSVARNGHLIAVGGEDGLTAFVDSRIDDSVVHRFYSHSNAIFDVLWNKNDSELITASGDRTVKVWDSATTELKNTLIGHSGSVKNVTGNPMNQSKFRIFIFLVDLAKLNSNCLSIDLLGSCSRDGSIMVFDTRSKNDGKGGSIVFKAEQAHSLRKTMIKRRRIGLDFGCSGTVSSVKFANDGYTLLSAGASDGLVKFWDIRFSKNNKKVLSRASFNPCERSGCSRQHGITSIDVSRDGGKLMVSSCNDT